MSAALIAKLISAGTPAELIAEVAMELAHAQAVQNAAERRKAKDRERKRFPRNSTEAAECAESPSPFEVSPGNPLPNSSNQSKSPLNPPAVFEEKKQAIASCLRVAFPCPDGVSAEQWASFRSQRKKNLNPRSYLLLCNKLKALAEAGWPPGDMIDLAIERGWETVFEPRSQANGSNVTSLRGTRPDPALDLLRAARAAEDREANRGAGTTLPALRSG